MNQSGVIKIAIATCVGGVIVWAALTQIGTGEDKTVPECIPEGGLRCEESNLVLCDNGTTKIAGGCPGGCLDEKGVVRCLSKASQLVAPVGAACQAGMTACGMQPNTLLVCKKNRLALAAECPGGCQDLLDEGQGLYCMDNEKSLRFAEGFPCPKFETNSLYACGPDSRSLLHCKDGFLSPHSVSCHRCTQDKRGALACRDKSNTGIDPETGKPLPAPISVKNKEKP